MTATTTPSIAARLLTTGDVHVTRKSNACVVNTGIELNARLDNATHQATIGNLEFEDLVTFLRLFLVEFEELLTEADDLATEAMEKADKWDEIEDEIDELRAAESRCEELESTLYSIASSVREYA